LGECQGRAEGKQRLEEAIPAFLQALTVFTRADLPRQWRVTQINLGRVLQLQIRLDGFSTGLEQVSRLLQADGLRDDPAAQASLRTLAIVCDAATERNADASRDFAALVALIKQQPDDFHLVWDWSQLRSLITVSDALGAKAHRQALLDLLDAVSRNNRQPILDGLTELELVFSDTHKKGGSR
jgi:hypothetical protein